MKINKKKLGFTLVELLVVIAILAVLATVAIIGYSSFINEAHKSNDNSVVTELNHYLKAANPLDEKVPTATDAAEKLEGCGLNIAELQPSAKDAYYGYDYVAKEFKYVEGPLTADSGEITTFLFAKNSTQVKDIYKAGYSVYLQKAYNETSGDYANANFKADNGLDVGEATVSAVNYTNTTSTTKDVVIRTNSANTTLTIDAASDTVKHYGAVGSLNIIAVAGSSYHEFGQVAFAEIANGRIVLESNSAVEHIHLNTTVVNNVTVFDNITVAKASDVEMPEFSRDPVEIPAEGKLVVALQDGTDKDDDKDYVWLTAVGVYEQVTVSESKTNAGHNYAANSNNEEKKEAAQQIANTITFSEGGEDYKVTAKTTDNGTTWTYEVVDNSGNVSEEYSATKDNTVNTVNVQTTGNNPVTVETTKENGLDEVSKNNLKDDLVITAKADEQIGEQLLGIKTVSINPESIDVYLPVNTSDGSLALEDIQNSTLVPFEFRFAGGVSFIAPESIDEEWNNATADFVISFDKDINPISSFTYNYNNAQHEASRENVEILPVIGVGKFGNNATSFWEKYKNMWLPCPITSDGYKANEEIALLKDVFESVGFDGVSVNCQELVNCIKEFSCGLVFLQDIGEVTITVKLVVTNNNEKYVVGSQQFTFDSADYVTTCPSGTYPEE